MIQEQDDEATIKVNVDSDRPSPLKGLVPPAMSAQAPSGSMPPEPIGDFSFASIARFPIPDLRTIDPGDAVFGLESSRRRQALFGEQDRSSMPWLERAAEYFCDLCAFAESDKFSMRLSIAAREQNDDRTLAKALRWLAVSAISSDNEERVRTYLGELADLETETQDPMIRGIAGYCLALATEKGALIEPNPNLRIRDHWNYPLLLFKESAAVLADYGEYDLSIVCHFEYSYSKIAHGEYITAIEWIERALQMAKANKAWKWTGRLLQVASSAATDQGYRIQLEETIRTAIAWCEYVGDEWGRIESVLTLGRLNMFEIPPASPEAASEPERIFHSAIADAERAGLPWLARRVNHAHKFLRQKSGAEEIHVPVDLPDAKFSHDIRRRIASRLEDGIADSPNPFLVFTALRGEDSTCKDFLNEYRNLAGVQTINRQIGYVALFSEISDNPYLLGLGEPMRQVTELRKRYEDVVEILADGKRVWTRRRLVPSGDGFVLTLRDITTEREIEETLRQTADTALRSERTMAEFLANMSHEIRTPINGVMGLARMLSETNLDETQRAYVKDIIGSGDILFRLIGDILDMSKIEAGFLEIVPEPVSVREIVFGIVGLYRGQAAEGSIALEHSVASDVPPLVLADGTRVRQVLANLVGNAIKFTPSGSVTIDVSMDHGMTLFSVTDTGIGITTDRLDRIFDPFHQATHSGKSNEGTGLGLTISKRLVELMNGTMAVRSSLGEGSRFTFSLPLQTTNLEPEGPTQDVPSTFTGIKVLLVEDNEVNLIVSEHFLRRLGCDVTCARDGRFAVQLSLEHYFDLIFMDVRMPVMDGLAATREIRKLEEETGVRTPIVALTAGAMTEERDRCFEAGMDDYVSKPFTDDTLRTVLAKWGLPA